MPDLRDEFEAKYQRSADDPASAEMLAIWEAAWNAATERAAKKEREQADELLKALKDLSSMYARTWDLVDGGLTMMGESVPLFEKRHKAASAAIKHYESAAIRAREGKGGAG